MNNLVVQHQKDDECWITSLAMVLGIPAAEAIIKFNSLSPAADYQTCIDAQLNRQFYRAASALLLQVGCEKVIHSGVYTQHFLPPAVPMPVLAPHTRLTKRLLAGRGILTVRWHAGSQPESHSVAFQDGMIADPNHAPGSPLLSLERWRKTHPYIRRVHAFHIVYLTGRELL